MERDTPPNRLRFTGEDPPQDLWPEFPNWEYALDEEDVEGQDETTLRPASVQDRITDEVAFTVGLARCSNGRQLPALLEVCDQRVDGVTAYPPSGKPWRLARLGQPSRWTPYLESWLPEEKRSFAPVSLAESELFPLIIESRLPTSAGSTIRLIVHPNGHESHAA
jgi:hypothetical protein